MNEKLAKLFETQDAILMDIGNELTKYDLLDYHFEHGIYYEIDFAEYPKELQEYLKFAGAELDKIDEAIETINN